MKCFAQIIILLVFFFPSVAQIEVIPTNTGKDLTQLSVIKNNIVITGEKDYLSKSIDACETLSLMNLPNPPGYQLNLSRPDSLVQYLLASSFQLYNNKIYKTVDGGLSWSLKIDTSGVHFQHICFFDSLEGLAIGTYGTYCAMLRTKNGGNSWTPSFPQIAVSISTILKVFGDSTVSLGGIHGSTGSIYVSKDRGNSWPLGSGGFAYSQPTGVYFLNKDTIFGISSFGNNYPLYPAAYFTKTFNGGLTWKNMPLNNYESYTGSYFKNAKEGYIIGSDNFGKGIIRKTKDLGQTWETFNTGLKSQLLQIQFLSDSIALVSGSNGVLFKWNSKQAIFTGIKENALNELNFKIFPNPAKDKLSFQYESSKMIKVNLSIRTLLGQRIYSKDQINLEEELDISFLEPGIYFVRFENKNVQKSFKIIKE